MQRHGDDNEPEVPGPIKSRLGYLLVGSGLILLSLLLGLLFWNYPNFLGPPGTHTLYHEDEYIIGPFIIGIIFIGGAWKKSK
ncbi:MAG: hypothetical protein HY226_02390 [Candidatus Vogelbacteria bacterium]|nr:hypothetical protein [Candidatus Vogelbacteria bacterium]